MIFSTQIILKDFRGLEIDILRCPELLAYHIMELFPDVRIEKRRLKVIQLCSQMDNKNNAERQVSIRYSLLFDYHSTVYLRQRSIFNTMETCQRFLHRSLKLVLYQKLIQIIRSLFL